MKKNLQATLVCLILLLWNVTFIAPSAMAADIPSVKPTQTFSNPNPAKNDNFAYSVAIDGDAVVIGARNKDVGAEDAGAAYLFKKSTGELLQTFSNPNPAENDKFGYSVAIDGDAVVIGTPAKDAGAAYLFKKSTGELLQTFSNPDSAEESTGFGGSVAIDGDAVVIGGQQKTTIRYAAAAYLFKKSTGELLQTFSNPNPTSMDNFGNSVAIDGDAVVIGTYNEDLGAVYFFKKSTGELLQTIRDPNPDQSEPNNFGSSVAIDEDAVVVGTPGKDGKPRDVGAAYLFKKSTGQLLQTFSNPNPASMDNFGNSVAIDGDAVVIGAKYKDGGAAYLFHKRTGELLQTFSKPNSGTRDLFGNSVAIDGDAVVIGAYEKDAGAKDAGAAYLYNIGNPTATTNTPDNSTPEDNTPKPTPTIVNIDAQTNNQDNPVIQPLKAGSYKVHLINTSEGGKFDAYDTVGFAIRGCDADGKNCTNGWETRYYYKSPKSHKVADTSCSNPVFGSCRYARASLATANPPVDEELTLSKDTEVKFYIYDSKNLSDNRGGVSLGITKQ